MNQISISLPSPSFNSSLQALTEQLQEAQGERDKSVGQAADLRNQLTAAQKNLTAITSESKGAGATSREKQLAEKVATLTLFNYSRNTLTHVYTRTHASYHTVQNAYRWRFLSTPHTTHRTPYTIHHTPRTTGGDS